MSAPYRELVVEAESAVASVKDPELRKIAFEKILDDLLLKTGSSQKAVHVPAASTGGVTQHKGTKEMPSTAPKSKRSGPQFYIEELVEEQFFAKQKSISEIKTALESRGFHIPLTSLSGPLQNLCKLKKLRRQKAGSDKKKVYLYSNW